jgi:glycosyltransferase involved in cell wall biosynthesis
VPNPRSVLIIGQNYAPETSGNAPYTTSLASGLATLGWSVRVLTAQPYYPNWAVAPGFDHWATSSEEHGVRVDRKRHFVPRRPNGLTRLLSELSFGARSVLAPWGKRDVVVFVSPSLFAVGVALVRAKLTHQPVVVWVQDLYSLGVSETGQGGARIANMMTAMESAVLRRADTIVTIHDRFRRNVIDVLGCRPDRVRVVRNWTHLPERAASDRARVRGRMGWNDDELIVLHAGNMGVKQGLENVVSAARLAGEQDKSVRFVLLGGGNQRDRLVALGRGVDRLEFVDPLPDEAFQEVLGAADVLLVNEKPGVSGMSVPSKLTSYMGTGLPVLAATDSGSVTEEEVRLSGAGVTVPAGDAAALVAAADELRSDPRKRVELGQSGLQFRQRHFDEPSAIGRYAHLLEEVVAGQRRPPAEDQGISQ